MVWDSICPEISRSGVVKMCVGILAPAVGICYLWRKWALGRCDKCVMFTSLFSILAIDNPFHQASTQSTLNISYSHAILIDHDTQTPGTPLLYPHINAIARIGLRKKDFS